MSREPINKNANAAVFFDGLWRQGDYWQLETSPFEWAKYQRQQWLVGDRHYARILEIGCGAGTFTRQLAAIGSEVLGLDVSAEAIQRAQLMGPGTGITYRCANVMEVDLSADGPWDLIVMSETIYYLGWLYSFFDVTWLASQLVASVRPGGRLLMANSLGDHLGGLLAPGAIRTYHDLIVNTGMVREREEYFHGEKDGTPIECVISVFTTPS